MNSTNIKVMSEEIQHIKDEVHNLDVEIPAHPSTDAGKYLGVDSDGSLAWSKVPDELPVTTSASAGQILTLDSNKDPEWADNYNLEYSSTPSDTGMKFNGKSVYRVCYKTTSPSSGSSYITLGNIGANMIMLEASMFSEYGENSFRSSIHALSLVYSVTTGSLSLYGSSTAPYNEKTTYITLYYCEDPYVEPEPTVNSTRKKTTKKGE